MSQDFNLGLGSICMTLYVQRILKKYFYQFSTKHKKNNQDLILNFETGVPCEDHKENLLEICYH